MEKALNNYDAPVSEVVMINVEGVICDSPAGQAGVQDIPGEEYSEE